MEHYETHCIFCSKNFGYELRPVLGFATARACEKCQKIFQQEIAKTIKEVEVEYGS